MLNSRRLVEGFAKDLDLSFQWRLYIKYTNVKLFTYKIYFEISLWKSYMRFENYGWHFEIKNSLESRIENRRVSWSWVELRKEKTIREKTVWDKLADSGIQKLESHDIKYCVTRCIFEWKNLTYEIKRLCFWSADFKASWGGFINNLFIVLEPGRILNHIFPRYLRSFVCLFVSFPLCRLWGNKKKKVSSWAGGWSRILSIIIYK